MGALTVHLLGKPRVLLDGQEQPAPRGRKGWGLLAYLLTSETSPTREWLVDLLFAEAEDPANALSWNLTQLRHLLDGRATLLGDPVAIRLPDDSWVDTHALLSSDWQHALRILGLGRPLLEGMSFPGCAGFEVWLLAARRRFAGAAEGVLREAARSFLTTDPGRAVELAARLVAADPLDEDAQELLVRGYAAAGDLAAARAQRDTCVALFQRELGTAPGPALLAAAADPRRGRTVSTAGSPTPARAAALLEAGVSALEAGAVDTAVDQLRGAVAESAGCGDELLRVRTLLGLGQALVHGVRGRDGEGAAVLLEAVGAAQRLGADRLAVTAYRELGHVELLRGRYDRARHWLDQALLVAGDDADERGWTLAVQGVVASDVGRYDEALADLSEAAALADGRLPQLEAWAATFTGRVHLVRGDLDEARRELARGLSVARETRWTSFVPLPQALLAEVDLRQGAVDVAEEAYQHAHALALQLDDPCWEGIAARGLGLVAQRRDDVDTARRWLGEARHRCVRLPDAYLWIEAYCLDALCALALDRGDPDAARHVDELEALASRTGMRGFVARAYGYRAALGQPAAAEAARILEAEVT